MPWARLSNVPTATTAAAGIIQIGTGAANAAAGNHTHSLTIAADSGTNALTLAHGTKYKITAGGSSFISTMPASGNTDTYVSSASFADDTSSNSSSPIKLTLTRSGTTSTSVTANIPRVTSASAGVVPKGAAVSSQS